MPVSNIGNMPDAAPQPEVTDRQLLLHILARIEAMWDELEQFRPLLAMIKGANGKPDMIGLMQARRDVKKAARRGP